MEFETLLPRIVRPPTAHTPVLKSAAIRTEPQDFQVDEIPTYLPNGSGEHLYLWVEKTDVSAGELISRLSRLLKIAARDIGVAGQKDRRAITRQFVSVPRSCEPLLSEFSDRQVRILSVSAHGNKLRTGHLRGNRFCIVLHPAAGETFSETQTKHVRQRLAELARTGFPNYFGPQRFGFDGNSIRDGIAVLRGSGDAPRWKPQQRRRMRRLVASAAQSAVFNLVLADRVQSGSFTIPQSGDVVCQRGGIRPFLFDERGNTPEDAVVPMGPMPGPKMLAATKTVHQREIERLADLQLTEDDFRRSPKLTPGVRRCFVEFPTDVSATLMPDGSIETRFALSAGSFATALLAEVVGVMESAQSFGRGTA